jgi:hypothetical protein
VARSRGLGRIRYRLQYRYTVRTRISTSITIGPSLTGLRGTQLTGSIIYTLVTHGSDLAHNSGLKISNGCQHHGQLAMTRRHRGQDSVAVTAARRSAHHTDVADGRGQNVSRRAAGQSSARGRALEIWPAWRLNGGRVLDAGDANAVESFISCIMGGQERLPCHRMAGRRREASQSRSRGTGQQRQHRTFVLLRI